MSGVGVMLAEDIVACWIVPTSHISTVPYSPRCSISSYSSSSSSSSKISVTVLAAVIAESLVTIGIA